MQNPALQPFEQFPEFPASLPGAPSPTDALTKEVNCGLCGTPIGTLADLELVATTPVHSTCLRYLIMMGRQGDGPPAGEVV